MNGKKLVMAASLLIAAAMVAVLNIIASPASAYTSSSINSASSNSEEPKFICLAGLADNATINPQMPLMPPMHRGWMRRHGFCGYGLEVSEGYKEKVLNIVKSDADVQKLLNEGYNITGIKPLIKSVVNEDGTVIAKATTAIVMLKKDATGRAMVLVDLEQGKVTKIVSLTLTVIEKP
ncbi:MAG: hypothetical protein QXE94_05955 [Candidatus Bathyarchaeia archaeon]